MQNRINANNTRWGCTVISAGAIIIVWSLGMSLSAPAAENGCDTLLAQIAKTGEVPAIIINPVDETVKVFSTKGSCSETIEKWSNREPLSATGN
ncbi:MAG: hypothetical protein O3A85_12555, partial [Proteobacteria bacterium]|nr:hypothetical protein [Pseudomonadota bacterium]